MALLEDLKERLKITWPDEDGRLTDIIESGKVYLQKAVGATLNFEIYGEPKTLLLEYGRYDYNNAIEYFEENFQSRLLSLQNDEEIKAYRAANPEVGA